MNSKEYFKLKDSIIKYADKCRYTYQDKNGNKQDFFDYSDRYSIGDTIQ